MVNNDTQRKNVNNFARRQEVLRILQMHRSQYITTQCICNALPPELRSSLKTIRRDLDALYDYDPVIEFQQGRGGGIKYVGSKSKHIFSFEQKAAIENSIERANAQNDTKTAQVLQCLLDQ